MKKKTLAIPVSHPSFQIKGPNFATSSKRPEALKKNLCEQNWRENPFFVQIEKDRREYNDSMGKRYNLNFNNDDNIFSLAPEAESEIKKGARADIIWTPLKHSSEVRWNSYEAQPN